MRRETMARQAGCGDDRLVIAALAVLEDAPGPPASCRSRTVAPQAGQTGDGQRLEAMRAGLLRQPGRLGEIGPGALEAALRAEQFAAPPQRLRQKEPLLGICPQGALHRLMRRRGLAAQALRLGESGQIQGSGRAGTGAVRAAQPRFVPGRHGGSMLLGAFPVAGQQLRVYP